VSVISIDGSSLGNALTQLLCAEDISPGDQPSYELCKTIWLFHPLGGKLVEAPIEIAQSQDREIRIGRGPEKRLRDAFLDQWREDGCDDHIYNTMATSRAYGIASIAIICEEVPPDQPIEPKNLYKLKISFSTFDPLNTAGSLVLNQDPNAIDFQKVMTIAVSGKPYHRSRTITVMNEKPVYIAYTTSAFGFVGRSVFQRILFPLKSFVQSMITDDLVTKKAGVFIAMLEAAGSIIDNLMQTFAGMKRLFVKQATNGNVISIGLKEKIETLNMQNIDGSYGMARKNILENIAAGSDGMPAQMINSETFAEGFGEGTEDAKKVARYIQRFRVKMATLYAFFDRIEMRRAWNPDFYRVIQEDFPEYRGRPYEQVFMEWQNSFSATWPNLLVEPDSEKAKSYKVKFEMWVAAVEVLMPALDPENKAKLVDWFAKNMNEDEEMFPSPLDLDIEDIATYVPPAPVVGEGGGKEPGPPKPFHDSAGKSLTAAQRRAQDAMDRSVANLIEDLAARRKATNGHAGVKH